MIPVDVCPGHGIPRTGSKEKSDSALRNIDRVHVVRKSQKPEAPGSPAAILVAKRSPEALPGLLPGRSKAIGAETSKKVTVVNIVTQQPALSLVVEPAFDGWPGIVPAFDVVAAAI